MSNAIFRGTTPEVECVTSTDLTGYKIYFAIGPKPLKKWAAVDPAEITIQRINNVTHITFSLTQEQTLACKVGKAYAQIRAIKDSNAIASELIPIQIMDIIEDGVIND